jgi:hypothetical protein
MTEFDPKIAEFTARGSTAALILDAQKQLSSRCITEILDKIENAVTNDRLTPDRAIGYCFALHSYRRIIRLQEQDINQARKVAHNG